MKTITSSSDLAMLTSDVDRTQTGPSLAAAMCGFLSTTVATTMLMFLLSTY
ncbi:hypothetical protein [Methylobacterium sp. Leaf108]|uniref:hypothetical protein n=1 Tax=Methylobacterium sp. Leaf108 TaxID=1736256 RepID=UPI000A7F8FA9|nr:hypothetical protein [Methylobacterium sp. Leaf108]